MRADKSEHKENKAALVKTLCEPSDVILLIINLKHKDQFTMRSL